MICSAARTPDCEFIMIVAACLATSADEQLVTPEYDGLPVLGQRLRADWCGPRTDKPMIRVSPVQSV